MNPVPVSAARAFGAEIVIAANLSSDVFAHSTTIYSHGPTAEVTVAATPEVMDPAPPKRGFGKFFCAERTVKREFFGGAGRPGISTIMVDPFNICRTRSPRTAAGDPPDLLISPRVGQIGWFDFHRADDLIAPWRARGRARHRIHSGGDRHSGAALGGRRPLADTDKSAKE